MHQWKERSNLGLSLPKFQWDLNAPQTVCLFAYKRACLSRVITVFPAHRPAEATPAEADGGPAARAAPVAPPGGGPARPEVVADHLDVRAHLRAVRGLPLLPHRLHARKRTALQVQKVSMGPGLAGSGRGS